MTDAFMIITCRKYEICMYRMLRSEVMTSPVCISDFDTSILYSKSAPLCPFIISNTQISQS